MKLDTLLIFVFAHFIILGNSNMTLPIIPQPQHVNLSGDEIDLPSEIYISISDSRLSFTAGEIVESLKGKSEAEIIENDSSAVIRLNIVGKLNSSLVNEFRDQAYMLTVSQKDILIEAETAAGIYYGAMSLVQLLQSTAGNSIQCMSITDYPKLKMRGISDDISRGQVSTVDNFKRIIRFISRYKMNTYMPYMEDMIQFESYPTIGKGRGALSKEEIKEIVAYADKHYVEVIPVFQTLGHYENILAQKEFLEYAEFPGAASLNVSYEGTYNFLETLLREVFDLFPSKYINMGADESYDVGLGASRHLVEQSSIAEVHAEHYNKVYDICKAHGKEVMMYSDIVLKHPEIMEMIPKDIIMIDWHYGLSFDYTSAGVFQRAGFEYCVSPAVWNFVTAFPINYIALPNIEYITRSGINNGASGMINSNWGDYGAETFKELVLYGYAWSAACSWSLDAIDITKFNALFFKDFFGIEDERLTEIYDTFGDQLNLVTWHDVWRHPALETRKSAWWEGDYSIVAKSYSLKHASAKVRTYLNELSSKVVSNRDQLIILHYLCDLYDFYANKLETHFYLRQKMRLSELNEMKINEKTDAAKMEAEKEKIESTLSQINLVDRIDDNITELSKLKTGFREIWLTYYKEANLERIEDKFDRLNQYFEEIKSELERDTISNPLIKSEWIYCADENGSYHSKAKFKKEFDISGSVQRAALHLLGDTHAKLFINGEFVDEVYVRRSLSLYTEYERIKYIDIQSYLRGGNNLIELEVESYNSKPYAGFNLIAEVITDNGTVNIMSDEDWLTMPHDKSAEWSRAVSKPYSFEVVGPDFNKGRPGWIER